MRTVWTFVFLIATGAGSACRGVPGAIEPPAASAADDSCQVATAAVADGPLSKEIATLQTRAAGSPGAEAALEQLGYTFVARARLAHDEGFNDAALHAASCLERRSPSNHQARLLRGHVLHQQHRFGEAEAIARNLVAARGAAIDHALLGDALMEQGRLTEAGEAYQRMIDLKPYYQSYVRAAHLRWLGVSSTAPSS